MNHELWHEDFYDLLKVLEMGAKKHGAHSWMTTNGPKSDHKSMHDSMFHHLAESFTHQRIDKESGLDPLLHLACRALMTYVRLKKGISFIMLENGIEVNSLGCVKINGVESIGNYSKLGYRVIGHNYKRYYVHSLVAEAFLGKRPKGLVVNHKDGNKANNELSNLEYVTHSQNIKHAYDTGLLVAYDRSGEHHPSNKLNQLQVDEIRNLYKSKKISYTELARMYEVNRTTIARIIKRKNWL